MTEEDGSDSNGHLSVAVGMIPPPAAASPYSLPAQRHRRLHDKTGPPLTDRDHHKKKRQSYGNDAATSNNFMTFGLLGARQ